MRFLYSNIFSEDDDTANCILTIPITMTNFNGETFSMTNFVQALNARGNKRANSFLFV